MLVHAPCAKQRLRDASRSGRTVHLQRRRARRVVPPRQREVAQVGHVVVVVVGEEEVVDDLRAVPPLEEPQSRAGAAVEQQPALPPCLSDEREVARARALQAQARTARADDDALHHLERGSDLPGDLVQHDLPDARHLLGGIRHRPPVHERGQELRQHRVPVLVPADEDVRVLPVRRSSPPRSCCWPAARPGTRGRSARACTPASRPRWTRPGPAPPCCRRSRPPAAPPARTPRACWRCAETMLALVLMKTCRLPARGPSGVYMTSHSNLPPTCVSVPAPGEAVGVAAQLAGGEGRRPPGTTAARLVQRAARPGGARSGPRRTAGPRSPPAGPSRLFFKSGVQRSPPYPQTKGSHLGQLLLAR